MPTCLKIHLPKKPITISHYSQLISTTIYSLLHFPLPFTQITQISIHSSVFTFKISHRPLPLTTPCLPLATASQKSQFTLHSQNLPLHYRYLPQDHNPCTVHLLNP